MEVIPRTLVQNSGGNAIRVLTELRVLFIETNDMHSGNHSTQAALVDDVVQAGIQTGDRGHAYDVHESSRVYAPVHHRPVTKSYGRTTYVVLVDPELPRDASKGFLTQSPHVQQHQIHVRHRETACAH